MMMMMIMMTGMRMRMVVVMMMMMIPDDATRISFFANLSLETHCHSIAEHSK